MKSYAVVFSLLLIFAIPFYPQKLKKEKKSANNKMLTSEENLSFKVHDTIPKFFLRYKESLDTTEHIFYIKVELRERKKGKPFQIIKLESQVFSEPLMYDYGQEDPGINGMFVDINFDGYKDLRYKMGEGCGSYCLNQTYNYYIYNPAKNRFEFNNDISNVGNPTPDYKQKLVYGYWRNVSYANDNTIDIYEWRENKLIHLKSFTYKLVKGMDPELEYGGKRCKYKRITEIFENNKRIHTYYKTVRLKNIPQNHMLYW